MLDLEQGFLMLTRNETPADPFSGAGAAFLLTDNSVYSDLDSAAFPPDPARKEPRLIFGANYFEKRTRAGGLELIHRITAPHNDSPTLVSRITVTNITDKPVCITAVDYWAIAPYFINKSSVVTWRGRRCFGVSPTLDLAGKVLATAQRFLRTDTDASRRRLARKFRCIPVRGENGAWIGFRLSGADCKSPARPFTPAPLPPEFKTVFLAPLNFRGECRGFHRCLNGASPGSAPAAAAKPAGAADPLQPGRGQTASDRALWWGRPLQLPPGGSETLLCLFGYAREAEIDSLVLEARHLAGDRWQSFEKTNANRWKVNLIKLQAPAEPWVERESRWHSSAVLGGCAYDALFKTHRLPQGSVYLFGHGLDGAIRDYALFLPALTALDPALGREFLRYILSLMEPDGALPYALHGCGATASTIHGKASDLHLSLLWAVAEYIYMTRDFAFLEEELPYYPSRGRISAAPGPALERVAQAIEWILSPRLGFGPHGMLKVNDGDWSDGITFLVKKRGRFVRRGESAYNTAMALYVLPKLLPLLEEKLPRLAPAVISAINRMEPAMAEAWNGRWFYRGYDGGGRPVGDKELFLDHHTWCLLSGRMPRERRETLLRYIDLLLDGPSPAGQLILYPPLPARWSLFPPGWDVNGGVWHAVNNLLTWACARYDGERAWRYARKNSLAAREQAYPSLWYGIWTGPDSYNAHYADRPGEAFYHLPTPMCDYPAGNMNLHAGALMAMLRLTGLEAGYDGFEIHTAALCRTMTLDSPLYKFSYRAESGALSLTYRSVYASAAPLSLIFSGPRAHRVRVERVEGAQMRRLPAAAAAACPGFEPGFLLEQISPRGFTAQFYLE